MYDKLTTKDVIINWALVVTLLAGLIWIGVTQ